MSVDWGAVRLPSLETLGGRRVGIGTLGPASAAGATPIVPPSPPRPSWVEAAITEAAGEFSEMPADAIRENFQQIFQQSEHHLLAAFLKMEQAAEEQEEMKAYMLKLVRLLPLIVVACRQLTS